FEEPADAQRLEPDRVRDQQGQQQEQDEQEPEAPLQDATHRMISPGSARKIAKRGRVRASPFRSPALSYPRAMNYRHAFHAGNHADVLKHVVLLALIDALARKETPFFVLDTHAGR